MLGESKFTVEHVYVWTRARFRGSSWYGMESLDGLRREFWDGWSVLEDGSWNPDPIGGWSDLRGEIIRLKGSASHRVELVWTTMTFRGTEDDRVMCIIIVGWCTE